MPRGTLPNRRRKAPPSPAGLPMSRRRDNLQRTILSAIAVGAAPPTQRRVRYAYDGNRRRPFRDFREPVSSSPMTGVHLM
jgi:hypothetical protein